MPLNEVKISAKQNSPEIILNPEGTIRIGGRWMNGNSSEFSKTIMDWADAYVRDPAETTYIDISCEYIGGVNSLILMSLLKKVFNVSKADKKVLVNWYYEDGDDGMLEQGEYIALTLEIPINFIMISADCNVLV